QPITKDDVRAALEHLRQSNQKTTMKNIRDVLKSGSNSTIGKYQRQLVAEELEKARLAQPLEPPPDVDKKAGDLSVSLARYAFEAGVKRGLSQVAILDDRIVTLELELDSLIADLDDASEQYRLSRVEVASVRESWQSEIREERRRADSARSEMEGLRAKFDAYEKSTVECLEELRRDLHKAQVDTAHKDVAIAKLKGKLLASTGRK
ncbi:MAG: DNA-binding protein, partial [Terrimicrobiaceae bacterium]